MAAKRELVARDIGHYTRGIMRARLQPGGWSIWVNHSGNYRHFIVGFSKEADALGAVITRVPGAQLVSSEPLAQDLLASLGVPQGEALERHRRTEAASLSVRRDITPPVEESKQFVGH
jgi:hypothetical protein